VINISLDISLEFQQKTFIMINMIVDTSIILFQTNVEKIKKEKYLNKRILLKIECQKD
jgi:hypothetical protein